MTAPPMHRTATRPTAPLPSTGFGLREAVLGNLGLWLALAASLFILGLAAGIALDPVDDAATPRNALWGVPAVLVALLPFVASPVLALGTGAWSGHATRSGTLGAIAGALGGVIGPLTLFIVGGLGLALGAAGAGVDLDAARMPYDLGAVADWRNALGYVFTGAGLVVLLATTVSGALSGWIVGSLLDGRWAAWGRPRYDAPRRPDARV